MKIGRGQKIAVWVAGFFILLILYILLLFDWNMLKGFAESKANSSTGRTIKINGDLDVSFGWNILSPVIELNDVTITNMATGSEGNMLEAKYVGVQFSLLSAFGSQLDFPYIEAKDANVLLEKDKQGNANWLFGEKDNKDSKVPNIGKLLVQNGKLTYRDATENTDLTVFANSGKDFRQNQTETREDFIAVKGEGKYKNNPFKVDYIGASVLDLQNRDEPYPLKTSVTIGHTQINVEGTVVDPEELKGLDITLNINGASASELFPIFGMALPPTPPYSLTGKLDYADKVWKFTGFKGRMGDSDLSGDLSWDTHRERPLLTAQFISKNLDFNDLGGFIGAAPKVESANVDLTDEQKARLAKEKQSPYVIPDAPLDISRLAAMDAKVEFTGKKVVSDNLPLDDFFMKLDLDDSFLIIDPLKFGTADGDISARFEVNARQEPVKISSDFKFNKLALSRLFEKMPIGNKNYNRGYIGGTAKLEGTGKSLRQMLGSSNGSIGLGMEGGQLSNLLIELVGLDVAESLGFIVAGDKPVPIRCVVADFGVKNGVMYSNNIIADTNDTNIKGQGKINLANEQMDLRLQARPKDTSILSLKSPITVGGTLKNPTVGIEAGELAVRGGVAAAASVVLTPVVGALAFVETGQGKDSDCSKLIAQMNSDNGVNRKKSFIPVNKNAPKTVPAAKKQANEKPVTPAVKVQETPALPGTTIPE